MKVSVRLRRLLAPVKSGTAAPAFVLRNAKSRTFDAVPPMATVPDRSLACEASAMSVVAFVAVIVTAPAPAACVIAPDCVNAPPAWIPSVPVPTPIVPSTKALVSRSATLFAPVLVRLTAPPKLFAPSVSVIAAAPALIAVVPVTTSPPAVSVTAPAFEFATRLPPTVPVPRFSAPVEVTVRFPDPMLSVPSVNALTSVI